MLKSLSLRRIVLSLAGFLAAIPLSHAAGTNWFGGIDVATKFLAQNSQNFSGGVDDTLKSRKIYGAFQMNRMLGFEMGTDFGRVNVRDNGLVDPGSLAPGLRAKSWQFSSTGTFPIGPKFGVTGKVGAYRGELDLADSLSIADDGKTKALYGLGLKYDFSQNFRLQGGWDRYRLGTDKVTADGDRNIDLLSIGLKYRF
jgi:opacity protein-like surface antigen